MDKLQFVMRQLAKTNKKNYENYVVTRLWHQLDNPDIKLVTQQYVTRPEGYALTDVFFPQFNLHVEIDEPYHTRQVDRDNLREQDVINATNHQIRRVKIQPGEKLECIHDQIGQIVEEIRENLVRQGDHFVPWDLEEENSPETHIRRGYMRVQDNVAFAKMYRACNCFGHSYIGLQKGGSRHPIEPNTWLWFPKLFPNGEWENTISPDEQVITEKHTDAGQAEKHRQKHIKENYHRRIIFAKVRGALGDVMYRFKGVFALDVEASYESLIWRKVSDEAKTYSPVHL